MYETFQGDTDLMDQFLDVRKRPTAETGLYPLSEEVLSFVERCMADVELTVHVAAQDIE